MTEWSSCEESTSGKKFVAGAIGQGASWGAAGFLFGEALGFGAGGLPGAGVGVLIGEGVNAAGFAIDYASCKINNKTFMHSMSDLFVGTKESPKASLPELKLDMK